MLKGKILDQQGKLNGKTLSKSVTVRRILISVLYEQNSIGGENVWDNRVVVCSYYFDGS